MFEGVSVSVLFLTQAVCMATYSHVAATCGIVTATYEFVLARPASKTLLSYKIDTAIQQIPGLLKSCIDEH